MAARRRRSKPEKIPHFVWNRIRNLKQPPESPFIKGDVGGLFVIRGTLGDVLAAAHNDNKPVNVLMKLHTSM